MMPAWWIKSELPNLLVWALQCGPSHPVCLPANPLAFAHILKAGGCQVPALPLPGGQLLPSWPSGGCQSSLGTQSHWLLLANESPSVSCHDCTFLALPLGCAAGFSDSSPWPRWAFCEGKGCVRLLAHALWPRASLSLCLSCCPVILVTLISCWKEGKNGVLHRCAINRCNPGKLKFTWKLN